MRKLKFVFFVISLMALNYASAYDDGDFQVWHTENQELRLNQNWKVTSEEEFRWGDNASELYYQHYDVGFVYGLNKNLDLGFNYRQVLDRDPTGKFRTENRPHVNGTVKWELLGFKFDDCNRLEYRNFETKDAIWTYRNKFSTKFPWKFTKFEIQPYLADEIFINFNSTGFSRNRFYAGLGVTFFKNLKGEIYYLLQASNSSGIWKDANVLGTKLKLIF